MLQRWLVGCVVLAVTAAIGLTRPGIVKTREGRTIEGEVSENADSIKISVRGIDTIVNRGEVETITYPASPRDEYNARLAKLDAKDTKGRMDLSHWAFDNHQYDLSREAAQGVLKLDANNREAVDMLDTIQRQQRLEATKGGGGKKANPGGTRPPAGVVPGERRYLTADDINTIRQREVKSGDKVRVRLDNNVGALYIKAFTIDPVEFNSLRPVDQALRIVDRKDNRFSKDVRVLEDPPSMVEYRKLQPMILSGCSLTACHGSTAGGNFILYNDTSPEAMYTNFYILQKYVKDAPGAATGGPFGGGAAEHRMIDRANPDQSLLVQYALPRDLARIAHPELPAGAFKAMFPRGIADPRYKQLVTWMGTSLNSVNPGDYGIVFQVPTAVPVVPAGTQPATGRAGG